MLEMKRLLNQKKKLVNLNIFFSINFLLFSVIFHYSIHSNLILFNFLDVESESFLFTSKKTIENSKKLRSKLKEIDT